MTIVYANPLLNILYKDRPSSQEEVTGLIKAIKSKAAILSTGAKQSDILSLADDAIRLNHILRQIKGVDSIDTITQLNKTIDPFVDQTIKKTMGKEENVFVIYIDLDHFGKLNKRYGHHNTNLVLRQFAEIMRETFKGEDYALARLFGDEFGIAMRDISEKRVLEQIEALRKNVNEKLHGYLRNAWGHNYDPSFDGEKITFSAGVSTTMPLNGKGNGANNRKSIYDRLADYIDLKHSKNDEVTEIIEQGITVADIDKPGKKAADLYVKKNPYFQRYFRGLIVDILKEEADKALSLAKSQGRDRTVLYDLTPLKNSNPA